MTFPVIASVGTSYNGVAATTHVVDLPDTINSGDLLILFFSKDGQTGTVTFPAGLPWSNLLGPALAGTSDHYVKYRIARSPEGTDITINTSLSEEGGGAVLFIP